MAEAAVTAPKVSRALWTLIAVEALSFLGSEISRFGVSVWLYESTQSVSTFAMLVLANTVPGMLVSPFAGSVVDRFSRKRVMIGAATISLCGTLIVLASALSGRLSLAPIALGAALASIGEAFQWPALSASLPLMASEEDLPRYNGFVESGRAASMLAGPIIGGAMFALVKLPGLLAVEVTTFITATLVVSLLHIPRPAGASEEHPTLALLFRDSFFGLKWIFAHKPLLKFLCVAVFANFFLSIGIVLMPPYGLSFLSERTYGIANGLFGGGMIAGGIAYGFLSGKLKNIQLFLWTALIMGALYASYGFARGVVTLAVLNFFLALLMTIGNSAIITIWQLKVPEEAAGRVLSAMSAVAYSTGPISYLVAGPLTDDVMPWIFTRTPALQQIFGSGKTAEMGLLFSAMGVVLFAGFVLASLVRDVREVEDRPA